MQTTESVYVLPSAAFHSLEQAQWITNELEENLINTHLGASNIQPTLVEIFSELVNNAAEHGASPEGAHAHVRYLPHRNGHAFDAVITDSGPGIRATLARNQNLNVPDNEADAITLAAQELVSGTGVPTRGIGLWMTLTEMQKPGRRLWIKSCSGLLTLYGNAQPETRETIHNPGTTIRLLIPA